GDKHITPVNDSYPCVTVYGKFKGIAENDIVLLKRESKICQYKVQSIQYFSPHSEEFFGELIWVGYEQ
ncbi:MAG TPA: hypothetical protein VIK14_16420, partial [Ignavibacteria bacterium]